MNEDQNPTQIRTQQILPDNETVVEQEEIDIVDAVSRRQPIHQSQHGNNLNRAQSFARLYQRNQTQDDGPFGCWCEAARPYGGRLGELNASHATPSLQSDCLLGQSEKMRLDKTIKDWLKQCFKDGLQHPFSEWCMMP